MKKVCRDCGKEKPIDQFSKGVKSPDGRHGVCKPCVTSKYQGSNSSRGKKDFDELKNNQRLEELSNKRELEVLKQRQRLLELGLM